jgi:hypothetical protein
VAFRAALAESVNGLYKTELIRAQGPWRTFRCEGYKASKLNFAGLRPVSRSTVRRTEDPRPDVQLPGPEPAPRSLCSTRSSARARRRTLPMNVRGSSIRNSIATGIL